MSDTVLPVEMRPSGEKADSMAQAGRNSATVEPRINPPTSVRRGRRQGDSLAGMKRGIERSRSLSPMPEDKIRRRKPSVADTVAQDQAQNDKPVVLVETPSLMTKTPVSKPTPMPAAEPIWPSQIEDGAEFGLASTKPTPAKVTGLNQTKRRSITRKETASSDIASPVAAEAETEEEAASKLQRRGNSTSSRSSADPVASSPPTTEKSTSRRSSSNRSSRSPSLVASMMPVLVEQDESQDSGSMSAVAQRVLDILEPNTDDAGSSVSEKRVRIGKFERKLYERPSSRESSTDLGLEDRSMDFSDDSETEAASVDMTEDIITEDESEGMHSPLLCAYMPGFNFKL
jgi:hypothetical protein